MNILRTSWSTCSQQNNLDFGDWPCPSRHADASRLPIRRRWATTCAFNSLLPLKRNTPPRWTVKNISKSTLILGKWFRLGALSMHISFLVLILWQSFAGRHWAPKGTTVDLHHFAYELGYDWLAIDRGPLEVDSLFCCVVVVHLVAGDAPSLLKFSKIWIRKKHWFSVMVRNWFLKSTAPTQCGYVPRAACKSH